jgi:hypothetical protein
MDGSCGRFPFALVILNPAKDLERVAAGCTITVVSAYLHFPRIGPKGRMANSL